MGKGGPDTVQHDCHSQQPQLPLIQFLKPGVQDYGREFFIPSHSYLLSQDFGLLNDVAVLAKRRAPEWMLWTWHLVGEIFFE